MKHTFPFYCMVIGGMLPLASSVFADNDPAQMKELCRDHARNVAGEIHKEVFSGMTADQSRQTESLIMENCLRQFAAAGNNAAATGSVTEEEDDDWFTRYVLEGKGTDKPGNRRLERMRRK